MAKFNKGEVWFAEFPYEEDNSILKYRPVVVLDVDTLGVLSIKVTRHSVRDDDPFDTPIVHWQDAGLYFASTARVSKVLNLQPDDFIFKFGVLHPDDLSKIEEVYIKFMNEKGATT